MNKGTLFHIKTEDVKESLRYLLPSEVQWLGQYVLIHEPYYLPQPMFDLPVLRSKSPFIPVATEKLSPVAVPIPEEAKDGAFYSIFGAIEDLKVTSVDVEYTCAAKACDGSHGEDRLCFGVDGSEGACGTLACTASSEMP